jgi:hypothetical protein
LNRYDEVQLILRDQGIDGVFSTKISDHPMNFMSPMVQNLRESHHLEDLRTKKSFSMLLQAAITVEVRREPLLNANY